MPAPKLNVTSAVNQVTLHFSAGSLNKDGFHDIREIKKVDISDAEHPIEHALNLAAYEILNSPRTSKDRITAFKVTSQIIVEVGGETLKGETHQLQPMSMFGSVSERTSEERQNSKYDRIEERVDLAGGGSDLLFYDYEVYDPTTRRRVFRQAKTHGYD